MYFKENLYSLIQESIAYILNAPNYELKESDRTDLLNISKFALEIFDIGNPKIDEANNYQYIIDEALAHNPSTSPKVDVYISFIGDIPENIEIPSLSTFNYYKEVKPLLINGYKRLHPEKYGYNIFKKN